MSEDQEPDSPEEIRAKAVSATVHSEGHEFNGKELNPFTVNCQIAAMEMGLKYGNASEDDIVTIKRTVKKGKKTEVQDASIYRQLFRDVIIVLWLCTLRNSDVKRAQRKPDEAIDQAVEWAAESGITLRSAQYGEAANIFVSIMSEIEDSKSVAVPRETGGEESPPGE